MQAAQYGTAVGFVCFYGINNAWTVDKMVKQSLYRPGQAL
jgi:hypothetical protein